MQTIRHYCWISFTAIFMATIIVWEIHLVTLPTMLTLIIFQLSWRTDAQSMVLVGRSVAYFTLGAAIVGYLAGNLEPDDIAVVSYMETLKSHALLIVFGLLAILQVSLLQSGIFVSRHRIAMIVGVLLIALFTISACFAKVLPADIYVILLTMLTAFSAGIELRRINSDITLM